jgi:hypothetical protein
MIPERPEEAAAILFTGRAGVKMACGPIRRQMTCGWPGTRTSGN